MQIDVVFLHKKPQLSTFNVTRYVTRYFLRDVVHLYDSSMSPTMSPIMSPRNLDIQCHWKLT